MTVPPFGLMTASVRHRFRRTRSEERIRIDADAIRRAVGAIGRFVAPGGGYLHRVAITSEQIWDLTTAEDVGTDKVPPGDAYVLGRPASSSHGESFRLRHEVDWGRLARSATAGLFDERDPGCSVRSTLAKMVGVVVVLTGIALVTLGMVAALGVWTIRAAMG
jgi:hypothetical protein